MAYLPDNRIIFHAFKHEYKTSPGVSVTMIWDLEKDTIIETWWRFPVAISYDNRYLACASEDTGRVATIVDMTTGQEVNYLPADKSLSYRETRGLSFSPDGRYLGCLVPCGQIWDIQLEKSVYLPWCARCLALSPNGKYLALGGSFVYLYDFERIKSKIEVASVPNPPLPLQATIIYPNPTHDVVQIKFALEKAELTTIKIVDLAGKEVRRIEDKLLSEGEYLYTIDLSNIASGTYYLQVEAGNKFFNEQIIVIR
jgi:WD40 repeat protein